MSLAAVALGVAVAHADLGITEVGGENMGPQVRKYLATCSPPISVAAPWCGAFVHFCAVVASRARQVANPLDAVKLDALVASYHAWATTSGKMVASSEAREGDLVLFKFGGKRWDHMGFVVRAPTIDGAFWTVEGNTNEAGAREGDGVFIKKRTHTGSYNVAFVRWS